MRSIAGIAVIVVVLSGLLVAQETRPVPKDSVRVTIAGCTKGYMLTAGPTIRDQPGSFGIPEGTHLRMNGPKKVIAAIDAYKGSMVSVTGLMKKGQPKGGVSVIPVPIQIDVEGWSPAVGRCPST